MEIKKLFERPFQAMIVLEEGAYHQMDHHMAVNFLHRAVTCDPEFKKIIDELVLKISNERIDELIQKKSRRRAEVSSPGS